MLRLVLCVQSDAVVSFFPNAPTEKEQQPSFFLLSAALPDAARCKTQSTGLPREQILS
jgi:hypothetical protein